jgi:hypothetical protein
MDRDYRELDWLDSESEVCFKGFEISGPFGSNKVIRVAWKPSSQLSEEHGSNSDGGE